MGAGAILVAFLAGIYLSAPADILPSPQHRPVDAVNFAQAIGLTSGRVFNDYDFGGYLIERHIKTSIDGRSVVFGDIFERYFRRPDPHLTDGATWLLVRPNVKADPQVWKRLYSDAIAAVYERR